VEFFALVIQKRQRVAVNGDKVLARDEYVDFPERRGVVFALAPGAVEDEKYIIAVVVELGPLMEVLGVFQRERVKAEQFMQLSELVVAWRSEVEPEELIACR
jgi:hypothetical protein